MGSDAFLKTEVSRSSTSVTPPKTSSNTFTRSRAGSSTFTTAVCPRNGPSTISTSVSLGDGVGHRHDLRVLHGGSQIGQRLLWNSGARRRRMHDPAHPRRGRTHGLPVLPLESGKQVVRKKGLGEPDQATPGGTLDFYPGAVYFDLRVCRKWAAAMCSCLGCERRQYQFFSRDEDSMDMGGSDRIRQRGILKATAA